MNDIEFRKKLAKLQTMLAINKAQVLSNPEPHLNALSEQVGKLLKVIDDIDYALSPEVVCDWAMSHEPPLRPMDVQGEALIRCNAAKKVLNDFRHS